MKGPKAESAACSDIAPLSDLWRALSRVVAPILLGMGEAHDDGGCHISAPATGVPDGDSRSSPEPHPSGFKALGSNTARAHAVGRLMYGAVYAGAGAFAPFMGVFFAGLGCSKQQVRARRLAVCVLVCWLGGRFRPLIFQV